MIRNRLQHIKAVSFDGDMTLWDFEKVMRNSLGYALSELRKFCPCDASMNLTVERMVEIRNETAFDLKGKVINLEEIRYIAFKRTVELIGSSDSSIAEHINAILKILNSMRMFFLP